MRFIDSRHNSIRFGSLGFLGLALAALVGCGQGETTATSGGGSNGSAALDGPIVFVNNTGDKSLTSIAMKGDSGNTVLNTIPSAEFEGGTLGDMQFSVGEWLFVNLGAANKVATIDPLTGATPEHEVNLTTGTRPVHIYRDSTNGEIIWSMNDGDNQGGPATAGDDLINCAAQTGGSVTILHNSHLGPGAVPPTVITTVCLLADGHHVAAFSSGAGIPKKAFVSSTTAGEIAVIGNDPLIPSQYHQLIGRIDLCTDAGEVANSQPACDVNADVANTPNTPNTSDPHGIRFSNLTKKVYSIQQGYGEIAEIDPDTYAITNTFVLKGTDYTNYGISPDGRFLIVRGETTSPQAIKLGVIDLSAASPTLVPLNVPELEGASNGSFSTGSSVFKFSPDGNRLYVLVGNSSLASVTNKDRVFAFDSSALSQNPPALNLLPNGEISLLQTGRHSMDVLALGPAGAGEAQYIIVSNTGTPGSVSIINAADNTIKETLDGADGIHSAPGSVLVYYVGAAASDNQASF